MTKTRLMQVLFSAVEEGDEKLTNMVGDDIRTAVRNGNVEDKMNGLSYEHKGNGVVAIKDRETGEVTMAERDPNGTEDEFELWAPDEDLERYVHPERDGVTPGNQRGARYDHAEDHIEGGSIADQPDTKEPIEDLARDGRRPEACPRCEEKNYSVNTAFQKVFSRQNLIEAVFSEVIESEETSTVGDMKFEKVPGENAIVVTDLKTGHQVKVAMDEENLSVTELESKNFHDCCEDDDYSYGQENALGYFVVGLDADNFQVVESQESTEEAAEAAAERFEEIGCTGVEIFDDLEEASIYARGLIGHLGGDIDNEEDEIEEREFSDGSVFYTRTFSTTHNDLMYRLFSESVANDGECPDENIIKDALDDREEVKVGDDVIIPVRDDLGVIHDTKNDEYTKVELRRGELVYTNIDEDEAEDILKEKDFSETEYLNNYMMRLFSEEADEEDIVDAIEEGEQVEHDNEIITPVDDETAVIEDKESGEFSKAVLSDDKESVEVTPISEEEADELIEEKKFSETYCNEEQTRFFSVREEMTDYMVRLFSEEADEEEIVDAIKEGDVVDNRDEVITPIDEKTAVIEDKENGEYTKAVLSDDEEDVEVTAISEEEAKELIEEKRYSDICCDEEQTRFFSIHEDMTDYMVRLFSEDADEEEIVDAIKEGDVVDNEEEVITPINDTTAVIEDKENGEYTKAVLSDDEEDVEVTAISEEEAKELMKEKEFSELYCDDAETRFFTGGEEMNGYMVRIFSEEADEEAVVDAIKEGEVAEHDGEIITPIDDKTAIVEDKESGEFTKATLEGDNEEAVNFKPISEEEAKDIIEEKKFSDIYCNDEETRFFSIHEDMTGYMVRLYSEEADEEEIVDAIKEGEVAENDNEIITPVDNEVAIIEDKETGEFTKAVLSDDEENVEVTPISEEEAKEIIKSAEETKENEKKFSTLSKFFAEINPAQGAEETVTKEVTLRPGQSIVILDENGNPVEQQPEAPEEGGEKPNPANAAMTVEEIEDKAVAAVQSIQEAAAAAEQAIQSAKAAPAENQEAPLQEAQFSQKTYSDSADTLITWLNGNRLG